MNVNKEESICKAIEKLSPLEKNYVFRFVACLQMMDSHQAASSAAADEIMQAFQEKAEADLLTRPECFEYVEALESALQISPRSLCFDHSKLREKINDKFGSLKTFAVAMGIHPSTLRRWLSNKSQMSLGAINKMADLLDLKQSEVNALFFERL